jgi:2-polyprenyl-6-methoxyphenol hydroxylase-like FAD-dependent oxidoreductase
MRASTDVLVVGAGPVGLLLACELQRQGVDYLLAERSPQRSSDEAAPRDASCSKCAHRYGAALPIGWRWL